jgi:ELWxxDGT repeat protein
VAKIYYSRGTADVADGVELWVTDSVTGEAHRIADLNPGVGSSSPVTLGAIGDKLIFAASDGGERNVFTTDGETITRIGPAGLSSPSGGYMFDGQLYFFATDAEHGCELWRTNGTVVERVTDVEAGATSSFGVGPEGFNTRFGFNGKLYLGVDSATMGEELFVYDPAAGITTLVENIAPEAGGPNGIRNSYPRNAVDFGDRFVFAATHAQYGVELWVSDGTPEGTQLLADLWHGSSLFDGLSSLAGHYGLGVLPGKAIFSAFTGPSWSIHVTDGTAEGTDVIAPGVASTSFTSSGDKVFFSGNNASSGTELWVTDGSADGTMMIRDMNPGSGSGVRSGIYGDLNGTLLFFGNNGQHGFELYRSNGTDVGTTLVKDINPGAEQSVVSGKTSIEVVGNEAFFVANDGTGESLWRTDGTEDGTYEVVEGPIGLILDVQAGDGPSIPTITGTPGKDKIDGTSSPTGQPKATNGAEIIDGRGGNDTVKALGGDDTVKGGDGHDSADGGKGADRLEGNKGNDTLIGGKGNDTLLGGAGKDSLDGGAGKDVFVFDSALGASNLDKIKGFKVADDVIWLDKDIFTKLGAVGSTIGNKAFWKSADGKAHDGNDRLIYESDTGKLTYDSNGKAAGGATLIATLDKGLALTQADFLIV